MLFSLLFSTTFHFALQLLTAFVFFLAGLLYFDSWQLNKKHKILFLRGIGFVLLATTAVTAATNSSTPWVLTCLQIVKILGLAFILYSLLNEPFLRKPKHVTLGTALPILILPTLPYALSPFVGALFILIALTYARKVTEGLEKQLKLPALSMFFLGIAELINTVFFWQDTTTAYWSKLLAQFGLVWIVDDAIQAIGIIILGIWVWGYIRFRLQLQLFTMTVALSLLIFLSTTVFFTFMLLRNLETDALSHLKTDLSVLQYAIVGLEEKTLANAQAIAQDSSVRKAFLENDKEALSRLTVNYLISQKTSTLIIASSKGEVLMRAEDRERTNDNIGNENFVKSALSGKSVTTVNLREGLTSPEITISAAVPIRGGGVVVTGFTVDSAFVDGVKSVTGLDTTVFGMDKRAATTYIAADGKSRFVGTKETNPAVLDTVLRRGDYYVGSDKIFNQPFYTAYAPLKSHDDKTIGMLFVGKPQNTLFDAARQSINLTLSGSIVLILLSLIPAYLFSRFLREQFEA